MTIAFRPALVSWLQPFQYPIEQPCARGRTAIVMGQAYHRMVAVTEQQTLVVRCKSDMEPESDRPVSDKTV